MMMLKRFALFCILLLSLWPSLGATAPSTANSQLEATLSSSKIILGETVTYTLKLYDQTQNFPEPDLQPLLANFDIVGANQSSQLINQNGTITSLQRWDLTLLPKQSGTLTLPPLRVEGLSSPELQLEVLPPSTKLVDGKPRDIFMETSLTPEQGYVQSQWIYRVKIYYATELIRANLTEPSAKDALIYQLEDDQRYQENRYGQPYQVLERQYALFPQKSGTLTVQAPTLSGAVRDPARPVNRFQQFMASGGQPIRLSAEPSQVEVSPKPATANGFWLPAKQVRLQESWSHDLQTVTLGQAITRQIDIIAEGLSAVQLPDLTVDAEQGLNTYEDKAQLKNELNENHVIGMRRESIAYVPTKAGRLNLPAIELTWWNTDTKKFETATLPARHIQVKPAADSSNSAPLTMPEPTTNPKPTAPPQPITTGKSIGLASPIWFWVSLALLVLWLLTIALLWRCHHRGKKPKAPPAATASNMTPEKSARAVVKAAKQADLVALQQALLQWGARTFPQQMLINLGQLRDQVNAPALQAQLELLCSILYTNNTASFHPEAFIQAFKTYLTQRRATVNKGQPSSLPDFYPSASVKKCDRNGRD